MDAKRSVRSFMIVFLRTSETRQACRDAQRQVTRYASLKRAARWFKFVVPIVALFLNGGCDTQPLSPDAARQELKRRGIENSAATFVATAKSDDVDTIKIFLDAGMEPDARGDSGRTACMQAAEAGSVAVLRALLESGATVDASDDDGRTALHWAAASPRGSLCFRVLLDHGADPNAKTRRGTTVLMSSVRILSEDSRLESRVLAKYIENVSMLLARGVDVNARNQDGVSALMLAAAFGNAKVVRLLIERDADLTAVDNLGRSARAYALDADNLEAAKLIEHAGG